MTGIIPNSIFVEIKKLGWIAYLIAAIIAIASGPITIPIILVAWFMIWLLKPKELQLFEPNENSYIPDKDIFDQFFGWAVRDEDPDSWSESDYSDSYQEFKQSDHYEQWKTHYAPTADAQIVLGLEDGFSDQELKIQFRKMLKKYHPDLGLDSERVARTKKTLEIIEAYHSIKK